MPVWESMPEPTQQEKYDIKKKTLIASANAVINSK